MGKSRTLSLGVDWHMPKRGGGYMARRFATTTVATSDLIRLLAGDGHTVQSAHDAILYDAEGKAVLARFVAEGHGTQALADIVRPWQEQTCPGWHVTPVPSPRDHNRVTGKRRHVQDEQVAHLVVGAE